MLSNEIKEQNRKLTEECRQIYDDIKFAEIKSNHLANIIVPIIFAVMFAVAFGGLLCFICVAVVSAPDWWVIGFFSVLTTLFTVAAAVAWYFAIKEYKYGRPWYFVRDDKNEYQIWCKYDGQKYIAQTIVNLTRHNVLYINENGDFSIDNDEDIASKVTGFYQYIVAPDKVYDSRQQSSAMRRNLKLRYKRKKCKNNKTYYYFPAFNNAVFGIRYVRCIMLENNVIKHICVENLSKHSDNSGTSAYTKKYLYGNVNNFEFRIYIPSYVREYAESVKFTLPLLQNIEYENQK